MKRNFFRRAFILYCLVLLVSIVSIESYITRVVRANHIDTVVDNLSIRANLLSEGIPINTSGNLDDFCQQMKSKINARITILDKEGRVLGDSDTPSFFMDDLADRPEIQQTRTSGTGTSIRFSDTIQKELLYVSHKIVRDSLDKGFIRLSVPLKDVNDSVNVLRLKINLTVIAIFLVAGSLSLWQTNRIRKLVNKISEYSGASARGLFRNILSLENSGEFTEITHNLNAMSSELRTNQSRINEETNRINVILRSIPDALLLINPDNTIQLSNNKSRELFGNQLLEGKVIAEVVQSSDLQILIDKVRLNRMPDSTELVLSRPAERYLVVRLSPLFYKVGEFAGTVAIFHDITDFKKLEQVRKDFVANVSHEIKTPVTAIKGFAETLLDGALHDSVNAEKFLTTIKAHSERLDRLVDDLLTISRIELGATKVTKTDVVIADVISSVIQTMAVQSAEKNLEMKTSITNEHTVIQADRDRLEQIFLNLLDNAIKFTEKGEIETGISQDNGKNFFYVRDTGAGIPEKYIERLGERFFRVDTSRSRELGGTGLGLAIVKHLVKAHAWDMKVESRVGEGTTVRIYY
jgi:two-component system phosphate regulon sensor histidine kinase PhoR